MDLDIVERKGSWYAYKGNNLAQGRQNVVDLLKQDTDLGAQLETEVRLALSELGTSSKKEAKGTTATSELVTELDDAFHEESEEVLVDEVHLE